jgi:hypothetical protein
MDEQIQPDQKQFDVETETDVSCGHSNSFQVGPEAGALAVPLKAISAVLRIGAALIQQGESYA